MRPSLTSLEIKERLLESTRTRHEELRLDDLEGKQTAKGIKFGHELLQRTPLLDDPAKYLQLLAQLLAEEESRIRGSADDDPQGRVLAGMRSVMDDIQAELAGLES